ncbi:hypothetical protein GCM10020218_072890 [Dactylosporangium vinaceum]
MQVPARGRRSGRRCARYGGVPTLLKRRHRTVRSERQQHPHPAVMLRSVPARTTVVAAVAAQTATKRAVEPVAAADRLLRQQRHIGTTVTPWRRTVGRPMTTSLTLLDRRF